MGPGYASSQPADDPATPTGARDTPSGVFRRQSETIGLRLTGALPCCVCRYDLRGLSVRSVCPECGTAVRATILYTVDPQAEAFQPLPLPRFTAIGLVLWPLGALLAGLLSLAPRVVDYFDKATQGYARGVSRETWLAPAIVTVCAVSFVGALGLVRPARGMTFLQTLLASLAALAYLPLMWAVWVIHARLDRVAAPPYVIAPPEFERCVMRLVLGACLVVILLGLRPNARRLVARSLTLRTGRVDRQTLLGMAIAVVIAAVGDGLRLVAINAGPGAATMLADAGAVCIVIGSLLLILGFASAIVDGVRIARAVLTPSPGLRDVLGALPSTQASPPTVTR